MDNLNGRREYLLASLSGNSFTRDHHQTFYDLVNQSLTANMPVIIAYRGTLPWDSTPRNHFMLINGVEGSPSNLMTLRYYVIDPDPSGPRPPNDESITSAYWIPLLFNSNNLNNANYIFYFGGTYFPPIEVDEKGFCKDKKNNKNKRLVNFNNDVIKNKKCIVKLITIDNKEITQFKILDENTKGGNLKEGTIYVGTDNGVYLIYPEGHVNRFNDLNFPIKDIILDGNGSAYVINDKCEIYHLNLVGWGSETTNMESCDLNKELRLYYNKDKSNKNNNYDWRYSIFSREKTGVYHNTLVKEFDLGLINPLNYKKIEFLGNYEMMSKSKISWGNTDYYTNKKIYDFNGLTDKLLQHNNFVPDEGYDYNEIFDFPDVSCNNAALQERKEEKWGLSWIDWYEGFGLNWRKYKNYKLQFIACQYTNFGSNNIGGTLFMIIGNGIRLYNDDESIRTKREIFDLNNLEEKNVTKWTDDLSKDINHEQHLSIDNKTNSINNITSL